MPDLNDWRIILLLVAAVSATSQSRNEPRRSEGDWPVYGGDAHGMKYSALTRINRENVAQLEPAWSWRTGEKPLAGPRLPIPGNAVRPGSLEVTPLVLDDVMYLPPAPAVSSLSSRRASANEQC